MINLFNLLELIEKVQALWVQQRPAWFDITARDDLLDWKFDLLAVHSCLNIVSLPYIISFDGSAYWNIGHLKDILGHMPLRQLIGNPFSDFTSEFSVEFDSWFHQQEQNNALIMVLGSALAYA